MPDAKQSRQSTTGIHLLRHNVSRVTMERHPAVMGIRTTRHRSRVPTITLVRVENHYNGEITSKLRHPDPRLCHMLVFLRT